MTRKFYDLDKIDQHPVTGSMSNAVAMATTARETKALAVSAAAIATHARDAIAAMRATAVETLQAGPAPVSIRAPRPSATVTEAIVKTTNETITNSIDRSTMQTADADLIRRTVDARAEQGSLLFSRRPETNSQPTSGAVRIATTEVCFNKNGGAVDGFFVKVKVSMNEETFRRTRLLRLFRCQSAAPALKRDYGSLTFQGMSRVSSQSGRKNNEFLPMTEKKFIENDVKSSLTTLLKTDQFTGMRLSFDAAGVSGSFVPTTKQVGTFVDKTRDAVASSFLHASILPRLDRSVAQDLNVIKNILQQDPTLRVNVFSAAQDVRLTVDKTATTVKTTVITERNNAAQFREIAIASLDATKKTEITIDDRTVVFGNTYTYYVSSVDENLSESVRSQLVTVSIENIVPPNAPTVIATAADRWITVSCSSDDRFVERFEIYRRESSLSSVSDNSLETNVVIARDGTPGSNIRTESGFTQIGETLAIPFSSSPFIDRQVVPGRSYLYRAYSIDCFGNKSQNFSEMTLFFADRSDRQNDLKKPTIIAELDSRTGFVKLKMTNDDDRVLSLRLQRQDMTIHEKSFHDPSFASFTRIGEVSVTRTRSATDAVLNDRTPSWVSNFSIQKIGKDVIEFVDRLARFDRTYKYSVFGIDRFGNVTPRAMSVPVFISRDPRVDVPINVAARLQTSGSMNSVLLSWSDANLNVSPLDLIGNRETLENNSVKMLFQVERKALSEEIWQQFPMTDKQYLIDDLSDSAAPKYRPSFVKRGNIYQYRVAAFQSGSFISDFSFPVAIRAELPVLPPVGLLIRTAEQTYRPFYVVLNWSRDVRSGAVDHWEIQRTALNNYAAASVSSQNEIEKLSFVNVANVGQEASRARPVAIDEEMSTKKNSTFFGERMFIDGDIEFGNTYFYRVRAVTPDGAVSAWEYRGVKVTSADFEKKLASSLDAKAQAQLVALNVPMRARE